MSQSIFRAYDIRGRYPVEIDESVAYRIGLAFANMLGKSGRVVVGRDVRVSGSRLAKAVAAGLSDGGLDVKDAGVVPTPVLYLGVVELGFNGGIQVTASHNPPEWNGFKLVTGDGETVSEARGMDVIRRLFNEARSRAPREEEPERIDLAPHYIERVKSLVRLRRRVKIVVDFSNGAGCVIGPRLLRELGCELIPLNAEPDGSFPAHPPEPRPDTLQELVGVLREWGADLGAGLDGDADRSLFVDDLGRFLEGDLSLAVLLHGLEKRGKVVYDVSSSSVVEDVAVRLGFEPVLSRTGRAFMLRRVREVKALIGAEKSNHIYFSELHGFDDGLYAVAKMAELVSSLSTPLSRLVDSLPKYYASSIRAVEVPDELKWRVVESVAGRLKARTQRLVEIDGVKAYLEDGWILVRPSNTMPQVKYTAESRTEAGLERLIRLVEELLGEVLGKGA